VRAEAHTDAPAPDLLTVEEAAGVLRIGRTTAYQLAREYLASNGRHGLPVTRWGKQLRVSRPRLEQTLGGPITWPIGVPEEPTPLPLTPIATTAARTPESPRSRQSDEQCSLPFPA